ncbi:hypothetical protein [Methylacidimicrobium sp. B4]|uniref:hypothetical protein n=1 Tax=Methylacidimicrobium sp. B4 TaxID=2796139 RepID=UPI001A8EC376|nr:hypothetical protein [Methylacidimicrobium sp. B4]QSR85173.1 hypothetical protein MacB4_02620 [Methylacidimicrobium sp. B4]
MDRSTALLPVHCALLYRPMLATGSSRFCSKPLRREKRLASALTDRLSEMGLVGLLEAF